MWNARNVSRIPSISAVYSSFCERSTWPLYLSPTSRPTSRIPASRYMQKIFDVNPRRWREKEKKERTREKEKRRARYKRNKTGRKRDRTRDAASREERFGSREREKEYESSPRTGRRYKSAILQLERLTFMVTGQLHLVGSLINIDRPAIRISLVLAPVTRPLPSRRQDPCFRLVEPGPK